MSLCDEFRNQFRNYHELLLNAPLIIAFELSFTGNFNDDVNCIASLYGASTRLSILFPVIYTQKRFCNITVVFVVV